MKAKRLLSLLLTAALMLSMVTPVLAASAETELPRASQTRLEETNEVVSIRLQAAGKLVYGSPFELSVVTRPADAQYIGVVLGIKGEAKGYVTLVLSDKLRTLLKMIPLPRKMSKTPDQVEEFNVYAYVKQLIDGNDVSVLSDIGVDIELFYLIRGLGHLAGQGYHLEQGAELIGEHEGDVALGFALDAQHHADILRVRRAGDHRQLERGAIDQLAGSLQTNGDDFIRLFQPGLRGAGQFGLCRGGQHRGHHAQHEGCCEKQRKQSFGLHMDKPPVFIIFSRAGRTG